jgi:hypothetical protein
MSQNEFNHLMNSIATLSPEQMERLYRELESKMATAPTAARPAAEQEQPAEAGKPIWEIIEEENRSIPPEVWDALPTDLAEQHDHYIYGTPKRSDA